MSSKKLQIGNPKQLVFIKELFLEAKKYASGHELELDLLKAILLIDLCMERLLNILLRDANSDHPVRVKRYPNFSELWEKIEKVLKEKGFIQGTLRNKSDFIDYHEKRNDAQHRGMVPRASYVQEYLELAQDFFVSIYNDLYEFDFLNFRYWDLVRNGDLRRLLQEADEALQRGDIILSLAGVNLAYDFAIGALKGHLFKSKRIADEVRFSHHSRSFEDNEVRRFIEDELKRFNEDLIKSMDVRFDVLYSQLLREQLGLSRELDEQFNKVRYGINPVMSVGGNLQITLWREKKDFNAEDAKFALSYMYDLIMRIQEKYPGSLETVHIPGSLFQV
jgi:hypothetical protein